jgi:hypothetical protein
VVDKTGARDSVAHSSCLAHFLTLHEELHIAVDVGVCQIEIVCQRVFVYVYVSLNILRHISKSKVRVLVFPASISSRLIT